jgi:hypothetical protein
MFLLFLYLFFYLCLFLCLLFQDFLTVLDEFKLFYFMGYVMTLYVVDEQIVKDLVTSGRGLV